MLGFNGAWATRNASGSRVSDASGGTVVVDTGDAVEELEDADGRANGLHKLGEDGEQRLEGEHRLPARDNWSQREERK